jgi:hypothetical protein
MPTFCVGKQLEQFNLLYAAQYITILRAISIHGSKLVPKQKQTSDKG